MSKARKPNSSNPARRNYAGAPGAAVGGGNVWVTMLRDDKTGHVFVGGVFRSEDDARACGIRCPFPDTAFFPLGPIGIGRDLFATEVGRTIIDTIPGTPDHDVVSARDDTEDPAPVTFPGRRATRRWWRLH